MKLARLVKQSACFKIRRSIICHCINWEEPTQWMMKSAIMFIHKTLFHKEPKQVLHEHRLPRTRSTALLSTSTAPKTAIFENTLIFKALTLFNALPDELKTLTPHQLKLKFKKFDVIQPKQLSGVSCKAQPQTLQRWRLLLLLNSIRHNEISFTLWRLLGERLGLNPKPESGPCYTLAGLGDKHHMSDELSYVYIQS